MNCPRSSTVLDRRLDAAAQRRRAGSWDRRAGRPRRASLRRRRSGRGAVDPPRGSSVYPGPSCSPGTGPRLGHRQARRLRHRRRRRPRPARDLPADGARERLHPDPVRGDDALRRLQRPRGRVPAVGRRRWSVRWRTSSARGSPTRSATTAARAAREAREVPAHQPAHLAWADRWFERYGAPAVFFSRMLPIVRTFISLPAGVARMPFWRFSVLTFAGLRCRGSSCSTFIGQQVGDELDGLEGLAALRRLRGRGAIVVGVVYLAVRWWRNRNRGRAADAPA